MITIKRRTFTFLLLIATVCAAQSVDADWHTLSAEDIIGAKVQYREHTGLKQFPMPVLYFERGGLASGPAEIEEIKKKIIVPLVRQSARPVSAIVVEFVPGMPTALSVLVLWADGDGRQSLIERKGTGIYDPEAYKVFFRKPTP